VIALQGNATADAATLTLGDSIVSLGGPDRRRLEDRAAKQIYVQLDPQSALARPRAPGHVKMALSEGRAHHRHPDESAPADLTVVDATAAIAGGAGVLHPEREGRWYAMFCEWSAARGDSRSEA
jgi:hypothetical protein